MVLLAQEVKVGLLKEVGLKVLTQKIIQQLFLLLLLVEMALEVDQYCHHLILVIRMKQRHYMPSVPKRVEILLKEMPEDSGVITIMIIILSQNLLLLLLQQ
jgi:hypothetical protein